ncbi:hypothetical protein [Ruegeria atlantica]|uniref:Uncharacterized protein n=1 Tax=Ruegeria atlantica TaxID=81569 RepID=A0A0N7LR27_9RHOB|nr:hypothetical protein [Ruegeria atlantica]CUH49652.1 hypothetical protein RUA4292_03849 [Ruegeria atlantica]
MPKVINHDMQTGYDVRFIWRFEVPLVQQTLGQGNVMREHKVDEVTKLPESGTTRSVGTAAGWGTAGAVMAGPLGALVGAAYGARSRGTTLYAIETKDGHNVIVETAKSKEIAKLDGLACHT